MNFIDGLAEEDIKTGARLSFKVDEHGLTPASSACASYSYCTSPLKNEVTCRRDSHILYKMNCGGPGQNE